MTFQNPLAFVKRRRIDLVVDGHEMVAYAVELEALSDIGDEYEWMKGVTRGDGIDEAKVPIPEILVVAGRLIGLSVAPDATPEERREIEASARLIDPMERLDLFRFILARSFKQLAHLESAEGNEETGTPPAPPKPNRQQRRAVRSTSGGAKLRT